MWSVGTAGGSAISKFRSACARLALMQFSVTKFAYFIVHPKDFPIEDRVFCLLMSTKCAEGMNFKVSLIQMMRSRNFQLLSSADVVADICATPVSTKCSYQWNVWEASGLVSCTLLSPYLHAWHTEIAPNTQLELFQNQSYIIFPTPHMFGSPCHNKPAWWGGNGQAVTTTHSSMYVNY